MRRDRSATGGKRGRPVGHVTTTGRRPAHRPVAISNCAILVPVILLDYLRGRTPDPEFAIRRLLDWLRDAPSISLSSARDPDLGIEMCPAGALVVLTLVDGAVSVVIATPEWHLIADLEQVAVHIRHAPLADLDRTGKPLRTVTGLDFIKADATISSQSAVQGRSPILTELSLFARSRTQAVSFEPQPGPDLDIGLARA